MSEENQRKPISKALRFEIFKRDKFTCQYCGQHAPHVVLQVDHINPVAQGGENDILNLTTSCFSCNNGKRATLLSDSSVVDKQHAQLALLEEKREQLELMIEWKRSLAQLEQERVSMIAEYLNEKMAGRSLSENGLVTVSKWLQKFEIESILDAIDISARQYLVYQDGVVTGDSASLFIDKIPGIIITKNKPLVEQKIAYAKGIGRNRYNYWDDRVAAIVFKDYVDALRKKRWEDNDIVADFDQQVFPMMKEKSNWSQWRSQMEHWIEDINGWKIE